MSEIKFRAWDKHRKCWIKDCDLIMEASGRVWAGDINNPPMVQIESENVVFYTGLKDKNGREIFEGDIVEFCDFDSLRTGGNTSDKIIRGYVSMSYGTWSIEVNGGDTVYELWNAHENDSELEVLGNRFENPELLEVQA